VTAIDMAPAQQVLDELGTVEPGHLIPLLQKIQDAYGYLPRDVLLEVSAATGIPASRMYGVATFYAQFHLKPRGRHTIRACRGTACHVRGSREVIAVIMNELGLKADGETTEDMRFSLETVACLGTCFLAPVVMIDEDYHGSLNPGKVARILKRYK